MLRLVLLGRKHFGLVEEYFVRVKGYPNNIDLEELATPSMVILSLDPRMNHLALNL